MFLSEAVDEIRETLVRRCAPTGDNLWSVILGQIRDRDCFDGRHGDAVEEAVRSFVNRLDDITVISLWRETESGMVDDAEDDELIPTNVGMALEMELLEAIINLAGDEARRTR